jgi:C-terminal processing protease CtpA/Prc
LFFLQDGSVLLISTKLYQRPSGELIQGLKLRDSGVVPDVLSPDEKFVSGLASESVSDDVERSLDHESYRKLQEAVEVEQFNAALKRLRSKVLSEAA